MDGWNIEPRCVYSWTQEFIVQPKLKILNSSHYQVRQRSIEDSIKEQRSGFWMVRVKKQVSKYWTLVAKGTGTSTRERRTSSTWAEPRITVSNCMYWPRPHSIHLGPNSFFLICIPWIPSNQGPSFYPRCDLAKPAGVGTYVHHSLSMIIICHVHHYILFLLLSQAPQLIILTLKFPHVNFFTFFIALRGPFFFFPFWSNLSSSSQVLVCVLA